MLAQSASSSSARIMARAVRTPWPISERCTVSVTELSGSILINRFGWNGTFAIGFAVGDSAVAVSTTDVVVGAGAAFADGTGRSAGGMAADAAGAGGSAEQPARYAPINN